MRPFITTALLLILAQCRPCFCEDQPGQSKTNISAPTPELQTANASQSEVTKKTSTETSKEFADRKVEGEQDEEDDYDLGFDYDKYPDDDEDDQDDEERKKYEDRIKGPNEKPVPRVDVRCRYQRMTWLKKRKNMLTYQVFMAPHGHHFPDWCDFMKAVVYSQCLKSEAKFMIKPNDIIWKRCDLESTDKVDGYEGYTAAFEMPQWGNKFTEENEKANVNCVVNAIQWAAQGSTVDYFYDDKCYHIVRKKYRLDAH